MINEQDMENAGDCKYLGSIIIKNGSIKSEIEEKVKQGRKLSGVLKAMIGKRNISAMVKMTLCDNI